MKMVYMQFLGVLFILTITSTLFALPSYTSLSVGATKSDYTTGYAEVYCPDAGFGLDYGKAKIEWHYWYETSGYWYYTYKVYNNKVGAPDDRTDDYHYGHVYDSGSTEPINTFDVVFGVDIPNVTGEELVVTSSLAGSNAGGEPWGDLTEQRYDSVTGQWYFTGVDWNAARGVTPGNDMPIEPTQWDLKGQTWSMTYAGDTSRSDSGSCQYFQFASTWMPGVVDGYVSNGLHTADALAYGEVYGPTTVPEPATCLLLGLGALRLITARRKQSL